MPKTNEDLDESLFGGFKFMDQTVPKEVNKAKAKETTEGDDKDKAKTPADKVAEAEAKALEEAKLAAEARDKKKAKAVEPDEEEEKEQVVDEVEDDKVQVEPDTESVLQVFAKELSDKGLLDLDAEDKIETDEDLFKAYEKTLNKAKAEDRSKLPEDAQKFLEFVDAGGNPADFHRLYYATDGGSFEDFTIENEEDQEHVVREGLALEGYSDEEIEDMVADFKDLNKLDKRAETLLKKLQKVEKEQKKLLVESQKEAFRKQEERKKAEWAEFEKGLFEKEEISGFKFNEKMKKDTWDYMTKVDRKTGKTQYQVDAESNPDARYMFAYLLKNKWDIKSLEKQVTTKVTSKIASKLNNYSDTRSKVSKGTPAKENTDGANPFAGFGSLLK